MVILIGPSYVATAYSFVRHQASNTSECRLFDNALLRGLTVNNLIQLGCKQTSVVFIISNVFCIITLCEFKDN